MPIDKPSPSFTDRLDDLAETIRAAWDEGHGDHASAIFNYLRIGQSLRLARRHFTADRDYGVWFRSQGFVFGGEWGRQMRFAAEHDSQVRAWWREEIDAGHEPSFKRCLAALRAQDTDRKRNSVATPIATNSYPESERRAWLEEALPRSIRGRQRANTANSLEQSLRVWETHQTPALRDLLADHLPDHDPDETSNIVAELFAVLRGQ